MPAINVIIKKPKNKPKKKFIKNKSGIPQINLEYLWTELKNYFYFHKPADGRWAKQNLTNDFEKNYMMFIEKSTRILEPGELPRAKNLES